MKINEVEALVGIIKKNIRFYEAEGLLTPRRNSENGYRDYGDADVAVLQRIKLLRKLGVPLEEIRQMQSGAHTVGDGMRRHLVTLEREQENLAAAARLCAGLTECREKLETLDAQALLEQMGKLACAKVNDAVKLAYLPEEERDAIGRLDLSALTEFRRSGAGTVEMKFTDRMRALERLLELSGPGGEEQLEQFLQRMEEPEA